MNELVQWWRGQNPDETRGDDEITLDLAGQFPEEFQSYPDAMADFARIRKDLLKKMATPGDYLKQAAGNVIRGAAGVIADIPEGAAVLASKPAAALESVVPIGRVLGNTKEEVADPTGSLVYKAGGAIRKLGEMIAPEPVEGLEDSFWPSKVPTGLGAAVGFTVGGAAGKLLKVPGAVGIAGMGAFSNGANSWKEAKAAGASDDDAYTVFMLNAGVGLSEAAPLARMLKRLDGATGKTFTKALVTAGKETFEEAVQESAQTFANNYFAKQIYDKDRDLLKDLADNAAVGGVTGFLFSALTQAIGAKVRKGSTPAPPAASATGSQPGSTPGVAGAGEVIDVRQNFVTDEDKAVVAEVVRLEREGKRETPEYDAASANLGQRIKSAPALLPYFTAEQAKATPEKTDEKIAGNADPELITALISEATTQFEQRRQELAAEEAKAQTKVELEAAAASAIDSAAPQVDPRLMAARRAAALPVEEQASVAAPPVAVLPNAPQAGMDGPAGAAAVAPVRVAAAPVAKMAAWQKLTPKSGIEDVLQKVVEQKASVAKGEGGQGHKDARLFEETESVEELYKDSRAGGNRTMSRKLAVLQAPDGSHVVIGTAYRNTSSGSKMLDMVTAYDEKGKAKPLRLETLLAAGWKIVGSIKSDAPTKGYAATYSLPEWQTLRGQLVQMRQAQAGTAAAMEEQLRQAGFAGREADKEVQAALEEAQQLTDGSQSELADRLEGLTQADDVTEGVAAPEQEKIKGFGPGEGKAIYDALQGRTRDELTDPETMMNALAASKRAIHGVGNLFKVLGQMGVVNLEDAEAASTFVYKLIYEASIQAERNDFAESLLSGIRAARAAQAQDGGAGRADAGAGGAGGAGAAVQAGAQEGAPAGGTAEAVAAAAAVTKANPTEAEKKSGRYPKGVVTIDGLDIVIETPQGVERSGKDASGKPWSVTLPVHYGYVKGTEGKDGDEVDVYIGEQPESNNVWVVDQINPKTNKFDEHKALIGFETREAAVAVYDAAFSDNSGPSRRGAVTLMFKQDFVDWVNEGNTEVALVYGKKVRHSSKSASLADELTAEMHAEEAGFVVEGPGWVAPNGDFIAADSGNVSSMDIGGHAQVAEAWLKANKPEVQAKLRPDSEVAIYDAMFKLDFVRVAGDRTQLYIEGTPNRTQLSLLKDSAIFNSSTLTHDLPGGRSRILYQPETERFSGYSETDRREDGIRFAALLSALQGLGVNVKLVADRLAEAGRYTQSQGNNGRVFRAITLSLADATRPTVGNFKHLLEEALHAVYGNESTERQAMMDRAIAKLNDDLLGIAGLQLSPEYSPAEAASALQEERLVAAVGKKLEAEGFNPAESGGLAQAIVRWLKDLYQRVVMAVMEASGLGASAERVQAYFENRVKAILSGDAQIGVIDFLGGPKLSEFEQMERDDPVGYAGLVVGVRHSAPLLRYVDNPREPVSPDQNGTELKQPQVAAQNFIQRVIEDLYGVFNSAGLNPMGVTFDAFARNAAFVQLPETIGQVVHYKAGEIPADVVAEINKGLVDIGQSQIPPDLKLEDVNEPMRKRTAAMAHRVLLLLNANLSEQRRVNERDAVRDFEQLQADNREWLDVLKDYTDINLMQTVAGRRMNEVIASLRQSVKTIDEASHRAGVLEQVIRGLGERLDGKNVTQWLKALDAAARKIGSGDIKFGDVLESVARLGVDWDTATPASIKGSIFTGGDKALAPLLEESNKAMLAALIAFGKTNANVMDLLSLRRESAIEERKTANEALNLAMEAHATAVTDAVELLRRKNLVKEERDASGNVIGVTPTRIGSKVLRILNRLRELKQRRRQLLDKIENAKRFNEWHELSRPVLRSRLTELEKIFGAQYQDWQFHDKASYPVPPKPDSPLAAVLSNQKEVDLSDVLGLRGDMMKLRDWLDTVPEDDRGADWTDLDAIYHKVSFADISRGHDAAKQNLILRHLSPLTDRLRFIGTPVTRLLAARLYHLDAWMRKFGAGNQGLGHLWEAAEARARKEMGISRQDVFRRMVFQPAMGWIEKHMDLLAAAKDSTSAEAAAVKGVMAYLESDPATRELLAKGKARSLMEKLLRQTVQSASTLAKNGSELGNKVLDEAGGYKVYRDPIGQSPFTVPRSVSDLCERVFNLMRDSAWAKQKIQRDAAVEAYHKDPEAMRAAAKPYVTPDIWKTFAFEWTHREGRAAFYAPAGLDGIQRFATRENVIAAYEAADGDLVKFAETLYELEGGKTDLADFVGDTLAQWQAHYDMIEVIHQDPGTSTNSRLPTAGPRRYLADARKSEELPAAFLEYLPYDAFTMRQVTRGQVYQAAFGRNLEAWDNNLGTAIDEQKAMADDYRSLEAYADNKGLTGKARKAVMRDEVAGGWKHVIGVREISRAVSFESLEQAAKNLQSLHKISTSFDSFTKLNASRPMEFRAWYNLIGSIAGATVSGPATAITDNIATVEQPFRKLGLDWQAVKWVMGEKKSAVMLAANSFLQAFGSHLATDAEHVRLANELGLIDDDATTAIKDKALAFFTEEHNLVNGKTDKVVWKLSQGIRFFLSTGIGKAKSGAPVFPTFKPHSPFMWAAQLTHLSTTLQWWKTYESLVGAAVRHFEANPDDLSNPDFKFTQRGINALGFKSGWRAYEFLTTRLADYGLGGLEQVARDTVARRSKDSGAALLSRDAYVKLAELSQNEITLDSGLATRHPFLVTNDKGSFLNPLLGWAVNKSYDFAAGFRGPDGKKSVQGTRTALTALVFGVLPTALAYALIRDLYDEYVMKRKGNVRDLRSISTPQDAMLTLVDNVNRVGTLGIVGEKFNELVNFDTARPVTLDSRIFVVSSLVSLQRSLTGIAMQGGAMDWATVYRPLLSSLGGSGYLQYADSLNGVLGLDNAERRVTRRMAVNNYLRAAGRELELDVRKSGPGAMTLPSETKVYVGQMVMAALANDAAAFNEAYRNARTAAKADGSDDPEDTIKRSFGAYHPLRLVFQTQPSEAEYRKMLAAMSEQGQASVAEAMRSYNHYATKLGITPSLGRKEGSGVTLKLGLPKLTLEDFRRKAAGVGVSGF